MSWPEELTRPALEISPAPAHRTKPKRVLAISWMPRIQEVTAEVFRIEVATMNQPGKGLDAESLARQVAIYLSRRTFGYATARVGAAFCRSASSISLACTKVSTWQEIDRNLAARIQRVRQQLEEEMAAL